MKHPCHPLRPQCPLALPRSFKGLAGGTVLAILLACVTPAADADVAALAARDDSWAERTQREEALTQFWRTNQGDLHWFRDVPVGEAGVPFVVFRLLGDVMPDRWGASSDYVARLGLFTAPTAEGSVENVTRTFNAVTDSTFGLPYGLGWVDKKIRFGLLSLPSLAVVNLTCAACHTGRALGDDGAVRYLIGAPSQTFTAAAWRVQLSETVNDEARFTVENFRKALQGKSLGWLYPGKPLKEVAETEVFKAKMSEILRAMKERVNQREDLLQNYIGKRTYDKTWSHSEGKDVHALLNGETPGQVEAFGSAVSILVPSEIKSLPEGPAKEAALRAFLPPKPAIVDIMSVWGQNKRSVAQWDGNIKNPLLRNLGAELGVLGQPEAADYDNASITQHFVGHLPPPVYPFAIDGSKLARGKEVYRNACASCHDSESGKGYPDIGTDPNRAIGLTEAARKVLSAAIYRTCPPEMRESEADCKPVAEAAVSAPRSYIAAPLDGIWARAPYFHNGSVPTLAQVLQPSTRAATFSRGSLAYDKEGVGFAWRPAGTNVKPFDTAREGLSNRGHDTPDMTFETDKESREALLEYLKTL
jgi:mono/diheme cytochrome c family protein